MHMFCISVYIYIEMPYVHGRHLQNLMPEMNIDMCWYMFTHVAVDLCYIHEIK